jgi:predicted PurR-regulated permease PerM
MIRRPPTSHSAGPTARPRLRPPAPPPPSRQWAVVLGWTLTFVAVGGGLLWALWSIFSVLFASAAFAYLLDPLVDTLEARGWTRTKGIGLIFLAVGLLIATVLLLLIPAVASQFADLIDNVRLYVDNLAGLIGPAAAYVEAQTGHEIPLDLDTLKRDLPGWLTQLSPDTRAGIQGFLSTVFKSSLGFFATILNLALLPIFTFYLLRDWDRLVGFLHSLVPQGQRTRVERMASAVDERLSAFVRGQITVCIILGILYSSGLWLSGIDLAVVVGLLSGALFIIPYLGTIVGLVLATLLCLMKFGPDEHLLFVVASFAIPQAIESWVLTPKIVGEKVGLHPLVVMVALLAGSSLGGIWGMLLAIPVTAALNVVGMEWLAAYRESRAMHGSP